VLSRTDAGAGNEASIVERLFARSESGVGSELAALTAGIVATDGGVGTDTSIRFGGRFLATVRQMLAAALGVPAATADVQPFTYEPGRLYVWEERDEQASRSERARRDFLLRAVYIADDRGERGRGTRERSATIEASAARSTLLATIEGAYASGLWDYASVVVEPSVVRGFGTRGVGLRITGYRIV
jgi:hypothetical protein